MSSDKPFKLALCMANLSKDGKLLLTKRCKEKRTFPNAWVMAGGSIELGESLEYGAIREVFEETGILIDNESSITPLCLFEDTPGLNTTTTVARSGHIILFFKTQLSQNACDIILKLQESEVSEAIWMSQGDLKDILENKEGFRPEVKLDGVDSTG